MLLPGCCAIPHEGNPPACPRNGEGTRSVGRVTLESLLIPEVKKQLLPQPYYFCPSPDCDVVYVSTLGDHLITKDQLVVRVGVKEKEDPVPLCYCFAHDRAAIRADIKARGETDIPTRIAARVKAGECRCEQTNPSGGCCLGSVYLAIREAKALKAAGAL